MERKEIVKALGEHFGVKPKYMKVPSCAYQIETADETYTVDRERKIITSEGKEVELGSLINGRIEMEEVCESTETKTEGFEVEYFGVTEPPICSGLSHSHAENEPLCCWLNHQLNEHVTVNTVEPKDRLYMGAEDATLYQGMGLTQEEYLRMSHSPRPIGASKAGSHVKSTPEEWLTLRGGGSILA